MAIVSKKLSILEQVFKFIQELLLRNAYWHIFLSLVLPLMSNQLSNTF